MQEEAITTGTPQQHPAPATEHIYYEVGRELLAKINALCDLIECAGLPKTIVFCNTPSDTDFVEVMLKKRGISAQKLIGNVPPVKLQKAIEQIGTGELSVLVVTDIAARGVNLGLFDLAFNYALSADADVYLDRSGLREGQTPVKRAICLINPLDIASFHFTKKGTGIEPEKRELPSAEELVDARAKVLGHQAARSAAGFSDQTKRLADLVMKEKDLKSIVTLLVHNTFETIPALRAAAAKIEAQAEEEQAFGADDDDEFGSAGNRERSPGRGMRSDRGERSSGDGRGDGRGEGRYGRGRNDRGGRGGGRDRQPYGGGRDGGRNGNRGGNGGARDFAEGEEDMSQSEALGVQEGGNRERGGDRGERNDRGGDRHRGGERRGRDRGGDRGGDRAGDRGERIDRGERGERGPRGDRDRDDRPHTPPKKDARIYLGVGAKHGFNREKLVGMLGGTELNDTSIKQLSVREIYSFVDIDDSSANQMIEGLKSAEIDGQKVLATKAITVNAPRPQEPDGDDDRPQRNSRDSGDRDSGDSHGLRSASDEGDDMGGDSFEENAQE